MEPLGKLSGTDTSNIRMLPSASKDFSIKFSEQCLQIIYNKYRLNGLKGSTKIQMR